MSEKKLIRVGQISTVILVFLGLLWIPLMKYVSGNLFNYLQSVQAYISPPIASVFLLGIFIKKLNNKGAMSALLIGGALGIFRLICEINQEMLSGILKSYTEINFLHFALFLFVICSSILIIVSLLTSGDNKDLSKITFNYKQRFQLTKKDTSDFYLSISLLVVIAIIWIIFS